MNGLPSSPATSTLAQPLVAENMELGTNFWDIAWGGSDPFINGFTNVSGENPWKPEFLEEIKIYTHFRFMDFNRVNWAERHHTGRWADRVQ